jgi:hypothetical protein
VFPIHNSRITIHGLFLLVVVHDFELRIDDVALFAGAFFSTTSRLRLRSGLRPWTWTGLR